MRKHLIIGSLIFAIIVDTAKANTLDACHASTYNEIKVILNNGIKLNNKFKESTDNSEYENLRVDNQAYYQETALPCLKKAGVILGQKNNLTLARTFFEFIVSYSNFADEDLAYTLGMLWAQSPAVITENIKNLPKEDKEWIIEQTKFGWMNVKTNFSHKTVRDRDMMITKWLH